jgi:type IV secretory pathway VirD2 relaxase
VRRSPNARRVIITARIVRHSGNRFRSAPLARHTAYLERDGVTRDGQDAKLFAASMEAADGKIFAERCEDDRHHFRFIVSPEDGGDLTDLRIHPTRQVLRSTVKLYLNPFLGGWLSADSMTH